MNQPALGKKIVELRKAKGLTQEELVEKCNLNVRTLQRIEAGEVTPRSYTVRTIFETLGFSPQGNDEMISTNTPGNGVALLNRLEQVFKYFLDLFNFKTNTMKKISVLSASLIGIVLIMTTVFTDSQAQITAKKLKASIEQKNQKFIEWFNTGQIDSLATLYTEDACIVSQGCGKTFIRNYYSSTTGQFNMQEVQVNDVSISDSMAVETGRWTIKLASGETLKGEYLAEWKLIGQRWLIAKEMTTVVQ